MAPKKPPPKGAAAAPSGKPSDANGLYLEDANLPLWDAGEVAREDWTGGRGELGNAPSIVDTEHLYCDLGQEKEPWRIGSVAAHNKGWKRPSAIFSPFKPVVVRQTIEDCPYESSLDNFKAECTPKSDKGPEAVQDGDGTGEDEDAAERSQRKSIQYHHRSREEVIADYRAVRRFKMANPVPGSDQGKRRGMSKRAEAKRTQATPCFMQVYNSCLAVLHNAHEEIPRGQYLWEVVYPQSTVGAGGTLKLPQYNPYGKYAVRLFVKGAWRKVTIDDRLPTDIFGQSLLTVTESKEIWPALIAKALLKVLGPGRQDVLFNDPMWVLWALLPGYIPQKMHTAAQTLSVLTHFRRANENAIKRAENALLEEDGSGAGTPEKKAAGDGGDAADAEAEGEDMGILIAVADKELARGLDAKSYFAASGLHLGQVYHIVEARPLTTPPTTMVRLVSPFIDWKGEGSYHDHEVWNEDFEAELGFRPCDAHTDDNCWNDCWMPWGAFTQIFPHVYNFRPTSARKSFAVHKVIKQPSLDDPNQAPTPRQGGAPITKWLHVKPHTPVNLLVAYCGEAGGTQPAPEDGDAAPAGAAAASPAIDVDAPPADGDDAAAAAAGEDPVDPAEDIPPPPPPPQFTLNVQSYDWKGSLPFKHVTTFAAPMDAVDSFPLTVPDAEESRSYMFECTNLEGAERMLSVMGDKELLWLDSLQELQAQHLNLSTWVDIGDVDPHAKGETNVWFKRLLQVKAPTRVNFTLETVPLGTLPPVAVDEGAAGKKPPPKKGKEPAAAAVPQKNLPQEEIDQINEDHAGRRITLISWARMALVNLDTGATLYDSLGVIAPETIPASKNGFLLVGYAEPQEDYPDSCYRVTAAADTPGFDKGTLVDCKNVTTKTGQYAVNEACTLFQYTVTPSEPTQTTVLVRLTAEAAVPFTITVHKNDEVMWQVEGWTSSYTSSAGPCFSDATGEGDTLRAHSDTPVIIENLSLNPPDKGGNVRYTIACSVAKGHAQSIHDAAHKHLLVKFRQVREERRAALVDERARLLKLIDDGGEVTEEEIAAVEARIAGIGSVAAAPAEGEEPAEEEPPRPDALHVDPRAINEHIPPEYAINYSLQFFASSGKLGVDESTAQKERFEEIKASWSAADASAAPAAAAAKGKGKAAPPPAANDPDSRESRAVRARQRFLANTDSVFLPRPVADPSGTGEKVLMKNPEEEPTLRMLPPAKIVTVSPPRDAPLVLKSAEYFKRCAGVVAAVNEDGTFDVTTDAEETLTAVPAADLEWETPPELAAADAAGDEAAEAAPPQMAAGTRVVVESRRRPTIGGQAFVVHNPPAAPAEDAPPDAAWAAAEAAQAEALKHDEDRLRRLHEEHLARSAKLKAKRSAVYEVHKRQKDDFFTTLRDRGLLPSDPVPEAPAKGGKKK
eukprot:TRINITY_DN3201_c0_g1_i2.p1 TRINITY_DN3201_c0_g1~~TRINITY_DN3201_c0_g1_i2.p1  ORF type:complete len:1408 (+),score=584.63 TRINITY_DN3201_c0_g1_i2:60-4283(+)